MQYNEISIRERKHGFSSAAPDRSTSIRFRTFAKRSQWPRDLRRRSVAALMLRMWVRIPPGHGWVSVVIVLCRQVSATSRTLIQRSPTDCGALLCVI